MATGSPAGWDDIAATLVAARAAFGELAALGSLEEGESLVRLAYAEALAASGAHGEASAVLSEARELLLARARRNRGPAAARAVPDGGARERAHRPRRARCDGDLAAPRARALRLVRPRVPGPRRDMGGWAPLR